MEKTLTLTFEDALLSPISFAMLSGAGLVHGKQADEEKGTKAEPIYVHTNYDMVAERVEIDGAKQLVCRLTNEDRNNAQLIVTREAPIYPVALDSAGAVAKYLSAITESQVFVDGENGITAAELGSHGEIKAGTNDILFILSADEPGDSRQDTASDVSIGTTVRVDCYEVHYEEAVSLQIDAESFAGYYYIEASTLFRDEATGADMPAEFVIPRGKIQTNFTFTMAASGDPSTFTFTVDCFPAYTKFNKKKKVMAELQIVSTTDTTHNYVEKSIMGHEHRESDADVNEWFTHSVFDNDTNVGE